MSLDEFRKKMHDAQFGKNDQVWFPKWLARYAAGKVLTKGVLPVTESLVIEFSKSLLKSGVPAWQRLQGVRAVEAYRDLVLGIPEPCLKRMKQVLGRLAASEKDSGAGAGSPGINDEKHLIGLIDPSEPQIIQAMRKEMRLRHLALETERAYIGWIVRFIRHCGSAELQSFGENEIKSFLTELAVAGNVTAGTQDQAKCALLFLYQQVLTRELAFLDVARANKAERLPVVLSREEIARLLPEFTDLRRLMFLVMYGSGLRHKECRRLRVKDLCFDEGHIIVRNGKGDKDRITVFPDRCRKELIDQVERVRRLQDSHGSRWTDKKRCASFFAPQFRDSSAGKRRGYSHGAGTAGAQ
jgi:hypothetical protein